MILLFKGNILTTKSNAGITRIRPTSGVEDQHEQDKDNDVWKPDPRSARRANAEH